MNEYVQGFIGTLGLLPPIAYSVLWWLGGRPGGRSIRRWVAPLAFSLLVVGYSLLLHKFTWPYLLSIPAYKVAAHVGYGGDTQMEKVLRRFIWALIQSSCALTFAVWSGAWSIFAVQLLMAVVSSTVFGTSNPFELAPKEEGIICFASSFLVPYMV